MLDWRSTPPRWRKSRSNPSWSRPSRIFPHIGARGTRRTCRSRCDPSVGGAKALLFPTPDRPHGRLRRNAERMAARRACPRSGRARARPPPSRTRTMSSARPRPETRKRSHYSSALRDVGRELDHRGGAVGRLHPPPQPMTAGGAGPSGRPWRKGLGYAFRSLGRFPTHQVSMQT